MANADEDLYQLFADLEPIKQDDGDNAVVAINYNETFVGFHNLFRAILQKNEISDRGFKLSERIIGLNSANYSAWQYRRECIFSLNKNLYDELEFSQNIALKSPKNYQLWWHRRILIDAILNRSNQQIEQIEQQTEQAEQTEESEQNVDYSEGYDLFSEKALIRAILSNDAKNYHAWSHLHWLLENYKDLNENELIHDELEYCNKLLESDIRNNSAWNHRHFVVKSTVSFESIKACQDEIEYCQNKLNMLADNDSIWYYYSDLCLKKFANALLIDCKDDETAFATKWNEWKANEIKFIKSLLNKSPHCARAILYYVDLLTQDAKGIKPTKKELETATQMLTVLADKVDRLRHNYYDYLKQSIIAKMEK